MRKTVEQKRNDANKRKLAYDSLSIAQKVQRLDRQLGKGIGAKKQRGRLERTK